MRVRSGAADDPKVRILAIKKNPKDGFRSA